MGKGNRIADFHLTGKKISFDGKQFCLRIPQSLVEILKRVGCWNREVEMVGVYESDKGGCSVMLVFRKRRTASEDAAPSKSDAPDTLSPDEDDEFVSINDLFETRGSG